MVSIKRMRTHKGISQEELAKVIGVSQSAVCQWEKGNTKPSRDNMNAIAQFFGCKVDDLIDK